MDKLAKTKDPKRNELRVRKNQWNKSTKKFIGDFIALKKGINGAGDSKHGIPPVSIDEPFPAQIGSFLNELAGSASKIIEEARQISKEQENYASSLDRKALSYSDAELIKLAELISNASWWGSRFLSRFKLQGPQKKYIIDMMYCLVEIVDKLKKFESELLTLGRKQIPNSFTTLTEVIKKYDATYLGSLKELQEFLPKKNRDNVEGKGSSRKILPENKPVEDIETERPSPKGKPNPFDFLVQINKEIDKFINDFESAEIIINVIINNPNLYTLDESLKKSLSEDLELYNKNYKIFLSLNSLEGDDPVVMHLNSTQIINLKGQLERVYNKLRKNINLVKINVPFSDEKGFGEVGAGKTPIGQLKNIANNSSFEDLLRELATIPGQGGVIQSSEVLSYSLVKEASFQNWLRSQYIGLNLDPVKIPDSFDIAQLNIYEISKEIRKSISDTLNLLENKDTSLSEIFKKSKLLNNLFIKIINNMMKLGDIYASFLRRSDRDKERYKIDIKYSDLSELKNLKNRIEQFNFPEFKEEIGSSSSSESTEEDV